MLISFSSETKDFTLLLTQVDKLFFGTQYLAATYLLLITFSKSLKASHQN